MKRDFYILGIGMSAGGLQAVSEFFSRFNPDLPVAIVLATHLQESHHAKLLDILSHKTGMTVETVTADTRLQKGLIYVIGAGLKAVAVQNWLKVSPADPGARTIDVLFNSLALEGGSLLIGMILSGTGNDGAEGLKAISEAGGQVLVQEPFSALYQSLPRLAIKTDHPDKILPPIRLATWINKKLATPQSSDMMI